MPEKLYCISCGTEVTEQTTEIAYDVFYYYCPNCEIPLMGFEVRGATIDLQNLQIFREV